MQRILSSQITSEAGKTVKMAGWVHVRRDHGKLIFVDLRDREGLTQVVILPSEKEAYDIGNKLRSEFVVEIEGEVNKRPDNMVNDKLASGTVELLAKKINILGESKEIPFELGTEVQIDTYLDHLPFTLRDAKALATFSVQATIIASFREFLAGKGFKEFQAPKVIGDDAEGGANSFNLEYFGHTAHLAQSPQLYKQIMVGVFERVFTAGNVYRAEKHSTSRHINEYTSMDFEMGFIEGHEDIMNMENEFLIYLMSQLKEKNAKDFELLGAEIPNIPSEIPKMKLREAQALIKEKYGEDCSSAPDLDPQHERWLCKYSKEKFDSDFIFITHFPITKRPFYTMEDPTDPGYAKGFDLLFRGLEITTGSQRIHDYDVLVKSLEGRKMDVSKFSYYLQAFKYGMPPHGGIGLGLERLTAKLLGIDNIKKATLFPRDINRIDNLLSK